MASGKQGVTRPELALLAAAADRGGSLLLPSALQDPVIDSLEVEGHLVRRDEEAEPGVELYRIQLTRSGWDLARRERPQTRGEPRPAQAGYRRPDVTPDAVTPPWRF